MNTITITGRVANPEVKTYDKGKMVGAYQEWHANGQPWSEGSYAVEGDASAPAGAWTTWYGDGAVASKVDLSGGTATLYAPGGSVWLSLTQKDGKWVDAVRQRAVAGAFSDGKPHGVWSVTDANGKKVEQTKMKKGIRNGEARVWHASGTLATEGKYANGAKTGTWPSWDANGKLLAVTCYAGGQKAWISFEAVDAKATCP